VARAPLRGLVWLFLLACVAITGCGGGRKVPEEENRLTKLARLYGRSQSKFRGPPPSVDALKEFARSLDADGLKSIGLESSDLDQIFVSSRDNEPFVYRKPAKGVGMPGPGASSEVVFYEKTGKNGKRYVAYVTAKVEEVDEAKFKQLVPETP